jgi:maltose alpha-D-glucosyltransferase / alpha-amylase
MPAGSSPPEVDLSTQTLLDLAGKDLQQLDGNLIGPFMQLAGLLGKRTAELHLTLASGTENPQFRPQPFTPYYQRSLYQGLRRLTGETMYTLRARMEDLPEMLQAHAHRVLDSEKEILEHARRIYSLRIDAARTRCHGDYHLSQVLYANGDFVFIDFEGEPGRLMSERQLARSPLKDIASMIRSFYYVAHAVPKSSERAHALGSTLGSDKSEPWLRYWVQQTAAAFLGEYLRTAGEASFIPRTQDQLLVLLDTFLLEHMLDELGDSLRNRPETVHLAIESLIEAVGPALQKV